MSSRPAANTSRTLQAYKDLAKGATTVLPSGGAAGGTPGTTDNADPTASNPALAGAGMLAPSTIVLAAAGLVAFLL